MGCTQSTDAGSDREEDSVNDLISSWIEGKKRDDARVLKLLLLGSGNSGKSTLFKQVKRMYVIDAFKESEFMEIRPVIRRNLLSQMLILLTKSAHFATHFPEKYGHLRLNVDGEEHKNGNHYDGSQRQFTNDIRLCLLYRRTTFDGHIPTREECEAAKVTEEKEDVDPEYISNLLEEMYELGPQYAVKQQQHPLTNPKVLRGIGSAISRLWALPAIQAVFKLRNVEHYSFVENMDYFFDKANECFKRSYVPSVEDVLKCGIPTTGIVQETYAIEDHDDLFLHIVDVGGQKNERRKWMHQFDGVKAVIFVAALNHYCTVLFEDEQINALQDSLKLFQNICNLKWFAKSGIIIFLNKDDLFRQRLRDGCRLDVCFNHNDKDKEWGWKGKLYTGPNYTDAMEHRPQYWTKRGKHKEADKKMEICQEDEESWFEYVYYESIEFIRSAYQSLSILLPTQDSEPLNPTEQKSTIHKPSIHKEKRTVYSHVTTATDFDSIKKVFEDVQNLTIQMMLKRARLV